VKTVAELTIPQKDDYTDDLKAILGSLNVASKEWIIRQYDHEVQSGSVVKPLVGVANDGPSDAAVVRPDLTSNRGLVISNGMNPCFGDYDPYWMAASAIDEAMRNAVAVGADPNRIAILDNFCWGNTERPETLGTLVRAAIACQDMAEAFGTPFISGKDSLNNEFSYVDGNGNQQQVTIPSSLLISALGQIDNVEMCVTMDLKQSGNQLFLIGETRNELGGSHIAKVNDLAGGKVPRVDATTALETFRALHSAIGKGLVASCHDLSEGGLAVAAAEMSFAGGLGIKITLSNQQAVAVQLFSESNSRFLVEVTPDAVEKLKDIFVMQTVGGQIPQLVELGEVTDNQRVVVEDSAGRIVIDADYNELKSTWKKPLNWT
jgi:phosphoribosylformylglycinamidine (FGAM) synthase-like enzyme